MISYANVKTPWDDLLLAADESKLVGLYFGGCAHIPEAMRHWTLDPEHPVLRQAGQQLAQYFGSARTSFSIPVNPAGTEFQQRVWREIARIPYGQTITYSELARRAGSADAIRAAGTAAGRNPIGIIIPCHRVVGKHGALGGFAGGLEWKRFLLALEQESSSVTSPALPMQSPQLAGCSSYR